jgi:hypothetical protein
MCRNSLKLVKYHNVYTKNVVVNIVTKDPLNKKLAYNFPLAL